MHARDAAATFAAVSLTLTLSLLATFIAAAVLAGWRGALPSDPKRGVRMVPWRFLMVLSAAISTLLLVHVMALLGGGQA